MTKACNISKVFTIFSTNLNGCLPQWFGLLKLEKAGDFNLVLEDRAGMPTSASTVVNEDC
jgi:hypothetical protein